MKQKKDGFERQDASPSQFGVNPQPSLNRLNLSAVCKLNADRISYRTLQVARMAETPKRKAGIELDSELRRPAEEWRIFGKHYRHLEIYIRPFLSFFPFLVSLFLLAMASNLIAMASHLIGMAPDAAFGHYLLIETVIHA